MYDKIFKGCSYLLLLFIVAAGVLAYVANSQVSGKPYVSKDRIETQFYLISHYEDLFARSLDQDSERYKILIKKIQEVQHTLILLNSGDDISVFQMHIYKATVERHNDAIDDLSQDFSENLLAAKKFYINKVKGDYKKLSSMPHNLFVSAIKEAGMKNGQVLWPARVALSGEEFSPGTLELIYLLGKEKSLERIDKVLKNLK